MTDGRAWIVKSHWPERKGASEVAVHGAVLLVRSPIDAIDSYWNFVLTQTHTDSVRESEYERLKAEWAAHVSREAAVWAAFHQHWLASKTPLLAIRYEDLLDTRRRAETLQLVAAFLCARAAPADGASPEASASALSGMLARVHAAAKESAAKESSARSADAAAAAANPCIAADGGVYQPRRGGVGGGLRHLSPEQRTELNSVLGAELCLFKYDSDPASAGFGTPLPGPPHAIYLDPQATDASAGRPAGAPTVLNRGKVLRPGGDSRGWRWRDACVPQDSDIAAGSSS